MHYCPVLYCKLRTRGASGELDAFFRCERQVKRMGRPLKYKTVEELRARIEDYFTYCAGELLKDDDGNAVTDKYGAPIRINVHAPTVTGLARFLGFKSRQALINYQGRKAFTDAVSEAKMRIEEYAEERLYDRDGVQGAKFTLCNNFGWSEKPEADADSEILHKLDEMIEGIGRAAE